MPRRPLGTARSGGVQARYRLIDPVDGRVIDHGGRPKNGGVIDDLSDQPRILLSCDEAPLIATDRA